MPHHGSAHQDEPWLLSLDPAVVLVSVGADNDYGHPAESALRPWSRPARRSFAPTRTATSPSWPTGAGRGWSPADELSGALS